MIDTPSAGRGSYSSYLLTDSDFMRMVMKDGDMFATIPVYTVRESKYPR